MNSMWRSGRLAAAAVLFAVSASAETAGTAQEPDAVACDELQFAMFQTIRTIEVAAGRDTAASEALLRVDPSLFASIPDKERFLAAAREIRRISEAAPAPATRRSVLRPLVGSSPFAPNYPNPSLDVNYAVLQPLGLVQNPWDRCGGSTLAYYAAALAGADAALQAAQLACDAAPCDPTGVVCISVCGATKIVQAAYKVAAIPINACAAWGSEVDSAENEAAYHNALLVLGDLSAHDDRVMAKLATQAGDTAELLAKLTALDTRLTKHDTEVKELLAAALTQLVANQLEIIKLLKTPEGRRPGWGKDGY